MTDDERRKRIRENVDKAFERSKFLKAIMTPAEIRKESDEVFAWLYCVPDIPQNERGVEYTAPCTCGGTIKAVRSGSNGHLRAWCESCGMKMRE